MDFVVVGMGVGALAALVGLLLRDRAGRRSPGTGAAAASTTRPLHRAGTLLTVAGALLALVTVGAAALGRDDRVGTIVVLTVLAIEVAIGIGWAARAVPRRPRTRMPVATADPAEPLLPALPAQPRRPAPRGSQGDDGLPPHAAAQPDPTAAREHGNSAASSADEGGPVDAGQSGELGPAVDVAPPPAIDGGFQDGSDGDSGSATVTEEGGGEDVPHTSTSAETDRDAAPASVADDAAPQGGPTPSVEATPRVGIDTGIAPAHIPDATSSPSDDGPNAFAEDAQPGDGSDGAPGPGDALAADGDADAAPARSRPDRKAGA